MRERFKLPIGLTITTLVAFAILIALGTWQLQRLHWKEGLLARIAALQAAPAKPVGDVLKNVAQGRDADFTRVVAECPGLPRAPFVELFSVRDGQVGARIISACKLQGAPYASILVDRGYISDTTAERPPVDAADMSPAQVTGILRKPEHGNLFSPANKAGHWYLRDAPAMAKALGAGPPAPLFLMAESATNPGFPALVPAPIPADIPNRHLEYALTWYGLAASLLGVYAAMLFRRRK